MDLKEFINKYQKVPVEEYPNKVLKEMPEPMVSCRVSTYQHAPYIRQCLDGILMQQTDFPFEIVIGEDESNDGTREICIEYAQKYPEKIRLFLHKRENNILMGGKPSAKFQGRYSVYMCRGKYHALCEGDDYWTDPLKLQKQVDFLEENKEYIACQHHRNILYPDGQMKFDKSSTYVFTQCLLFRNILDDNYYKYAVKVFSGDTFLKHYLMLNGKYTYLDFTGAVYRYSGTGIYSSLNLIEKKNKGIATFETILELQDIYKEKKHQKVFDKVKRHLTEFEYERSELDKKNKKLFFRYLRAVVKYNRFLKLIEYKRIFRYLFR